MPTIDLGKWSWLANSAIDFGVPAIGMAFGLPGLVSTFTVSALKKALGLASDREQPIVVYSAEAMTPVVARGGELRVQYNLVGRCTCDVIIDRFVYDRFKTRFELPDTTIKAGLPLGEDHYVVPVRIPDDAEPGAAVYRTSSTYMCNPLQRLWPIVGGVRDIPFIIK